MSYNGRELMTVDQGRMLLENINKRKAPAIILESEETYYHSMSNVLSVTIKDNENAIGTVKYADKKNYYPLQNYSETKAGVEVVGDGCFWTLNGTSSVNDTYTGSSMNVDLSAGTYTIVAYVDTGESVIGTNGLQFGITARYTDGTNARTNTYIKDANKTFTLTFAKDVDRLTGHFGLITDYTFSDYKVWFGLFESGVTIVNTEVSLDEGETLELANLDISEIDTCMHQSVTTSVADTKQYIDDKEIDINEELTYITPERFGAVGDGVTDDNTALVSCVAYAIQNGTPIRGHGKYFTSSGIIIEGDDLDIEINQIITTTTDTAAVTLTGYRNRIKINYLYAYSGNCHGFYLLGKLNHWSEFNEIHLPCIYAKNNAIRIDTDQDGAYACQNIFYTQYIRSTSSDCIRIIGGYGENVFYGGGKVICPNGWAINVAAAGCKFYNFSLESEARSGMLISCYNTYAFGFRIAELRGQKTPSSGDTGILVKFVGDKAFANIIEFADIINIIDIDASEATPVEELDPTTVTGAIPQMYNIIRGTGVRGAGYYASPSGYNTLYGKEVIVLHEKVIIVPYGLLQIDVDSNLDYTTADYSKVFANYFVIKSACTITLNETYCPIGFNEIYIDQTDAKVVVYKNSDIIFNGNNYDNGIYKLICYSDMKNSYQEKILYDGTNEKWLVTEIKNASSSANFQNAINDYFGE